MSIRNNEVAKAIRGTEHMLERWNSWHTANSGVMERSQILLEYIKDLETLNESLAKALMRADNDIVTLSKRVDILQESLDHSNATLISYMRKVGDLL